MVIVVKVPPPLGRARLTPAPPSCPPDRFGGVLLEHRGACPTDPVNVVVSVDQWGDNVSELGQLRDRQNGAGEFVGQPARLRALARRCRIIRRSAAFNAAEAEAIRRRRNDFSRQQQQRLSRAQSLLRIASDTAATPQERGHAYEVARKELDGLIVLPDSTRTAIERGIAGEIDG